MTRASAAYAKPVKQRAGRAKPQRPAPLSETVSRQMSAMPGRDTGTEMALRRELHNRGMRSRTHVKTLPGKPDIAFTRARMSVFVDGCFWHRCADHGTAPKNNGKWWADKLDANVARGRRNNDELRKLGWTTVHVWEYEDPAAAAEVITKQWRSRLTTDVGEP